MRRVKGNSTLGTVVLMSDQRDHTHHSDKKKQKTRTVPCWVKGMPGKAEKKGNGQPVFVRSTTTFIWLTLCMTHVQHRSIKKREKNRCSQDRELHLRAHVLSRSCTVSRKEKKKTSFSRARVWLLKTWKKSMQPAPPDYWGEMQSIASKCIWKGEESGRK